MKKNFCCIFVAMISLSLRADQPAGSNAPAMTPAAVPDASLTATNAADTKPAARRRTPAKPAARRTKPAELRTVPLVPGPAVVVANHVNVRGKAGMKGEVITRMTNGEPVTVIEEIELKHSGVDEPSAWAKIALPEKAHSWVHVNYIDRSTMTVKASKLNLRAGPGENYSVIGSVEKGDTVKELQTKGDWMEVETKNPPFAFMAAQYLKQEASAATITTVEPPPSATATIPETPTIASNTMETPIVDSMTSTGEVASATTTLPGATSTPVVEEPLPPRIVEHEGYVRGTFSIQAPTKFQLISPDTHRPINYLFTTSTNLDLSRYKGLHIIVTGEEGLDERWRNTPVITIQKIQVLD